ncbi:helix-turn-helix domain-containing protein [Flavobacterium tegetincola]|uniref:helix-turn-helix domain-containing protein n=1 Tax=Flavobacterium tegetincola TaxID=150172 RepID=UPI00047AD59B|nr:helix-turn-helix domain-containing protein [Flavobacterium tegetincola]
MQPSTIKHHSTKDIIDFFGDLPQESEGLHVYIAKNEFNEIPVSYPFRTDNQTFMLILKGEVHIQLNLIHYVLGPNEMVVVKPHTVMHILKMSTDLKLVGICFSNEFILKNNFKKTDYDAFNFFTASNIPKLKLSKEERVATLAIAKLLAKNNQTTENPLPFRKEIIRNGFTTLMYQLAAIFRTEHPNIEAEFSRQEDLTLRFLAILNLNFKKERTVQFYADELAVTTGHLSKVLKDVSGKTASQLIEDSVIMEARLLLNNSSMTIAQVADELQFSDQSFFGKYFKKQTGFSPSKYKNIA